MTFIGGVLCGVICTILFFAGFILVLLFALKPLIGKVSTEAKIQTKMMMLSGVMSMMKIVKEMQWSTTEDCPTQLPDLTWIETYCLSELEKTGTEIAALRAEECRKKQ